jgi:hypothetical protein
VSTLDEALAQHCSEQNPPRGHLEQVPPTGGHVSNAATGLTSPQDLNTVLVSLKHTLMVQLGMDMLHLQVNQPLCMKLRKI